MRMEEKMFSRFAELTPSFKASGTEDVDFDVIQRDNKNKTSQKTNLKIVGKKSEDGERTHGKEKLVYTADMSEPITYLHRIIPLILQGVVPSELRLLISEKKIIKNNHCNDLSDKEILTAIGILEHAKVGSRYSLVTCPEGLCIKYEGKSVLNGKKNAISLNSIEFNTLIYVICVAILSDLSNALIDPQVYQSINFIIQSRKMTYNPFSKVASVIPIIGYNIPKIVSLILMDTKISLVSLSFMIRNCELPTNLLKYYERQSDDDNVILNFVPSKNSYELLVANGMYERIRVNFNGKVKGIFKPRTSKFIENWTAESKHNDWV